MELFLSSSLTGNMIGIISLIIGIISLVITVKTMKTASRIEKEVRDAQVVALDKKRFQNNKEAYIHKLSSIRKVVRENGNLSLSVCNDVLSIYNDIKGYNTIITEKDLDTIEVQRQTLQKISRDVQNRIDMNESIQEFDCVVSKVISIISGGGYDI